MIKQPDVIVSVIVTESDAEHGMAAIDLTWDTPKLYSDGTILHPEDITGYEIDYAGEVIFVEPRFNTLIISSAKAGTHTFKIRTLTKEGAGKYSESIDVNT